MLKLGQNVVLTHKHTTIRKFREKRLRILVLLVFLGLVFALKKV